MRRDGAQSFGVQRYRDTNCQAPPPPQHLIHFSQQADDPCPPGSEEKAEFARSGSRSQHMATVEFES